MDNVAILPALIDNSKKEKRDLFICNLDMSRAYDGINRNMLILRKIQMPKQIVNYIRLRKNNSSFLRHRTHPPRTPRTLLFISLSKDKKIKSGRTRFKITDKK